MYNLFLTTLLPMLITAGIIIHYYEIIVPKKKHVNYSVYQAWIDFIKVNIDTCKTTDQCMECTNLIKSFSRMFRPHMPQENFINLLNDLYNRLDTKYKLLITEETQKIKVAVNN